MRGDAKEKENIEYHKAGGRICLPNEEIVESSAKHKVAKCC